MDTVTSQQTGPLHPDSVLAGHDTGNGPYKAGLQAAILFSKLNDFLKGYLCPKMVFS